MRTQLLTGALIAALVVPAAQAQVRIDGNKLLPYCLEAVRAADESVLDPLGGGTYCIGLTEGIRVMSEVLLPSCGGSVQLCIPPGTTNGQIVRVVVKYLQEHPEELHKDGTLLVVAALVATYSCSQGLAR